MEDEKLNRQTNSLSMGTCSYMWKERDLEKNARVEKRILFMWLMKIGRTDGI